MLTDNAKEQFEHWYIKMLRQKPDIQNRFWDENLLSFFWNSDDTMRNSYIIDWLDSVNINIHTDITPECYISKVYNTSLEFPDFEEKFYHNISRHEVQKQLIKVANEMYNNDVRPNSLT